VEKVFLVGHDWGAIIAWHFCLLRPDRIKALVNMSVPLLRRNPKVKPIDEYRALYGDDFYMCRFQVINSILIYSSFQVKLLETSLFYVLLLVVWC